MKNLSSISNYSQREQKRRRIGGIVIISLLVFSTLGFAISIVGIGGNKATPDENQGFNYNGQYWIYTAGSQQYYFTYHPSELNYSAQLDKSLIDFSNRQVFVDTEIPSGLQEIYNTLGLYSGRISEACYGACDRDLPEKNDCTEPIIVIRESEIESIEELGSCTFINGTLKTVDSFLYETLGIN